MDNLEVRVHSEISSYSEKFYGLTVRQWIAIVLSLFCDIPLFIMLKDFINSDILQIIIVMITAPILAVGFIRIQELPFEQFFAYFKRSYLHMYKPLKFQSDKDYQLEKEYYQNLSFTKKINYLINKDKANDIPINDRIKMEGKEKTLSKKKIKELQALEKKKIKAQQKVDKQRKKEEKKLRKMYKKKEVEEQEIRAKKVLEETQNYVDSSSFENDFIDSEKNEDLKENFYYMDEDFSEQQIIQSQTVEQSILSNDLNSSSLSKDKVENDTMKNTTDVKDTNVFNNNTSSIMDEIKNKEEEIKNLQNKDEYKDSTIDLTALMNSFVNK